MAGDLIREVRRGTLSHIKADVASKAHRRRGGRSRRLPSSFIGGRGERSAAGWQLIDCIVAVPRQQHQEENTELVVEIDPPRVRVLRRT